MRLETNALKDIRSVDLTGLRPLLRLVCGVTLPAPETFGRRRSGQLALDGGDVIVSKSRLGRRRVEKSFCAGAAGLLLSLNFAGCHLKPALTPQQAEGKHLYDVRCAHCHDFNDLQLKKVPPDLHGLFNRSTLPSGAPATDLQVARTVMTGKGMMPSFAGRFTTAQMEALLAYLHTAQFITKEGRS